MHVLRVDIVMGIRGDCFLSTFSAVTIASPAGAFTIAVLLILVGLMRGRLLYSLILDSDLSTLLPSRHQKKFIRHDLVHAATEHEMR